MPSEPIPVVSLDDLDVTIRTLATLEGASRAEKEAGLTRLFSRARLAVDQVAEHHRQLAQFEADRETATTEPPTT